MDEEKNMTPGLDLHAKMEALLFYYGEPMQTKKMANVLGIKKEKCEAALLEWETTLKNNGSCGVTLLRSNDMVQLATKPELKDIGEKVLKEEIRENLTPATLETLALVAYLGPLPRSTVDYIRGVNSSFTLRNLVMRGLVDRDQEGNMYSYRPSFAFLKHMGIEKTGDLPEFDHFHAILKRFESQSVESQSIENVSVADQTSPTI